MGMAVGSKRGVKSDINVTPLVDVVLVLLIIFMVITPMLQQGKNVKLPKAKSVAAAEEPKGADADPLIIAVTSDQEIFIDKTQYDEENLQKKLEREFEAAPNRKILLKGDKSLNFEPVREVMEIARKAGAKGVALGVEADKEAPQ